MNTESRLDIHVDRIFSGVAIKGSEFTVRFVPNAEGLIGVDVIAHLDLEGRSFNSMLGQDRADSQFDLGDIRLVDGLLECMRVQDDFPFYSEGFRVVLEPGMSDRIATLKPLLNRVAVVAASIERRFSQIIGEVPYLHMTGFFAEVVAAIVLDGDDHDIALAKIKATHWAGKDERLMAPFQDDQIKHLLATARPIPAH